MLKKFFKKQKEVDLNKKNILVAALLIHAAKIDENYTEDEKQIIVKAMMNIGQIALDEAYRLLKLAEEKERE